MERGPLSTTRTQPRAVEQEINSRLHLGTQHLSEQISPNWLQDHLDRYLASDGKDGHMWHGMPTLLLTTSGRRSGTSRQIPLIYGESNGDLVVVASRGGNPRHPSWYLNLVADQDVRVQVKADRFAARARTAEGSERERLWKLMAGIFPTYNDYAAATERLIPVVVLERV